MHLLGGWKMDVEARFYPQPSDGAIKLYRGSVPESTAPYYGVVSVKLYKDDAHLFAANGDFCTQGLLAICLELIQLNVSKAVIERRKGHTVPLGQLVHSGEVIDIWTIDLESDKFTKYCKRMSCGEKIKGKAGKT